MSGLRDERLGMSAVSEAQILSETEDLRGESCPDVGAPKDRFLQEPGLIVVKGDCGMLVKV